MGKWISQMISGGSFRRIEVEHRFNAPPNDFRDTGPGYYFLYLCDRISLIPLCIPDQ